MTRNRLPKQYISCAEQPFRKVGLIRPSFFGNNTLRKVRVSVKLMKPGPELILLPFLQKTGILEDTGNERDSHIPYLV